MWGGDSSRFSVACPMCLLDGAAQVGITKKGWPFCHCRACGSRCFANSQYALQVWRERSPDALARLEAVVARSREAPASAVVAHDHDVTAATGS
jgi:hypothetical protein